MIDDLFPNLKWDNEGPAPAFKPYTHHTNKASQWLKTNALPIIGLILAVAI